MGIIPIRQIRVVGSEAFVPLSRGLECVIDASDIGLVHGVNWCASRMRGGHTYAVTGAVVGGIATTVRMHRLLVNAPDGFDVDHIDMDTLNNRRNNLRVCSRSQNLGNKLVRSDSSTGIKGVFLHPNGRYRAKIKFDGKQIHIGYFDSPAEAEMAYAAKAEELFGEFSRSTL